MSANDPHAHAEPAPPKSPGLAQSIYLLEIAKGLGITMRHFVQNLLHRRAMPTISYPEERRPYSQIFRGAHKINLREDGTPKCVACMMCATVCPAECITIVAEASPNPAIEKRPKSFEIDAMRCVMCGFCVDACPCDAIIMTGEYELAQYSREACVWDLDFLTRRPSLQTAPKGYTPRLQ